MLEQLDRLDIFSASLSRHRVTVFKDLNPVLRFYMVVLSPAAESVQGRELVHK